MNQARKTEDGFMSFSEGNLVDKAFVLQMRDLERFIAFNKLKCDDRCLDLTEDKPVAIRVTDEQAKIIIKKISKCESVADFQALNEDKRNKYLAKSKEKGLSIRQITRLKGISKSIVEKATIDRLRFRDNLLLKVERQWRRKETLSTVPCIPELDR